MNALWTAFQGPHLYSYVNSYFFVSYKTDFQISLSLPSSSIIVGTDPGKRTANVTGKLPQPITNVDLRNVAIKEEKGGDLQNLPVGSYTILYTVEGRPGSSPSPKQVKLPLQVKGQCLILFFLMWKLIGEILWCFSRFTYLRILCVDFCEIIAEYKI